MRGNPFFHRLDRYAGPIVLLALWPFVQLMDLLRRLSWSTEVWEPKRIAVSKLAGIGDLVLATAVIRDLLDRYPDAMITVYVGKDNAGLAPLLPDRCCVETLNIMRPWQELPRIWRRDFDLWIDLGQWSRMEAIYAGLSLATRRLGFWRPGLYRHYLFTGAVLHLATQHEIDNFRELAILAGGNGLASPQLNAPETTSLPSSLILPDANKPVIIFHPWPSGIYRERKCWPTKHWVELGQYFHAQGYVLWITGGPEDMVASKELVDMMHKHHITCESLAGRYKLSEMVLVLTRARMVLAVNTGVMHMAAALDVPTVGLHGPTNPLRWGPVGAHTIAIAPPTEAGGGYLDFGWEYHRGPTDCFEKLQSGRVIEGLQDWEKA